MKHEPDVSLADAALDDATLLRLSAAIGAAMGLHFTPERHANLARGVHYAARDFGFGGEQAAQECAAWLLQAPLTIAQIETLARHLTIGETYFFRDRPIFEALRTTILPQLVKTRRATGRRELRFWSAACCTGEEPYSLAILLLQTLPQLIPDWRDWDITVLGTDLNPYFLKKAEAGVYGNWSFRNITAQEQAAFFQKTPEGRYQLKDEPRGIVRFAQLNLVTDRYPALLNGTAQQDVIFCRNVLMYFSADVARRVVEGLSRCLHDGGYLVPGASEASPPLFAPLHAVPLTDALLYRKGETYVETRSEAHTEARPPNRDNTTRPAIAAPRPISVITTAPVKAAPATVTDWQAEARQAAGAGRLDEALRCCDHAIAADKMNARLHYLRASILLEQNSLEGAEAALRRALYLAPDFALAHFALGNLARRYGRNEAARRAWQIALRLMSELPPETPLEEGDDLSAGRLCEIIERALTTLEE